MKAMTAARWQRLGPCPPRLVLAGCRATPAGRSERRSSRRPASIRLRPNGSRECCKPPAAAGLLASTTPVRLRSRTLRSRQTAGVRFYSDLVKGRLSPSTSYHVVQGRLPCSVRPSGSSRRSLATARLGSFPDLGQRRSDRRPTGALQGMASLDAGRAGPGYSAGQAELDACSSLRIISPKTTTRNVSVGTLQPRSATSRKVAFTGR